MPIKRFIQPVVTFGVLAAAVLASFFRTSPPAPLPVDAPALEFSAERAIEHIRVIAGEPRLVGSPAYARARDYLIARLTELGFTTDVQDTSIRGAPVENILGRLNGTESSDAILLMAHLDSTANSPGATDDASGVAAVLETVRALKAGPPLRDTIMVLFTGPEELGGYGALAFVRAHPWAKDVRVVIDVDAGGITGPSILAATAPEGGWLVREFARAAPYPLGSSAIEALGNPQTDYTLALEPAGFVGYDFSLSWDKRIYSPYDSIENLNPASLQHQGEHMLAMARHLGTLSLQIPPEPLPVYFDVLGLGVVLYPTAWAVPFMLLVAVLLAGTILLGLRRKLLSLSGIGLGALTWLVSLVSAPILIQVLWLGIYATLPANFVPTAVSFDILYWLRWAFGILAVALTAGWVALAQKIKKISLPDLVIGANSLLFLATLGTSIAFPALSYVFTWPLLFSLLAIAAWFSRSTGREAAIPPEGFVGLLVAACVAVGLILPDVLIALMSLEVGEVYLATIFIIVLLGYLVPQLHILINKWRQNVTP